MTSSTFPPFSKSNISFPEDAFLLAALSYTRQHTTPTTVNHCLRSAAYALIAINKVPHLASASKPLVVLSCILHDMGWATTKELLSKDKRFEVDGANLGRAWMREMGNWDQREIQILWDTIALHTTPSIAMHKEPEVAVAAIGIAADFFGAKMPGGLFTLEEQKEIVGAFPRLGFHDEVIHVMCGLCREKPETTYDNFVSSFGLKHGLGGGGKSKEKFAKEVESHSMIGTMMPVLKANEEEEKAEGLT